MKRRALAVALLLAAATVVDGTWPAAPRVCFLDLDALVRHCTARPLAGAPR